MKKIGLCICLMLMLVACGKSENQSLNINFDKINELSLLVKEACVNASDGRVSFMGIGDNLIHDVINIRADEANGAIDNDRDYTSIYEYIKDDIKNADLAFINQEIILGGEELGLSGYPTFNTSQDLAPNLHDLGFDLYNTATNHSLDRGYQGIVNSSNTWSQFDDICVAGTYVSQEDRDTIRVIEREGIKFAFLAYTYGTNGLIPTYDWEVAYFDETAIRNDVEKAKQVADVIIVSAHWGDENTHVANDFQRTYAQLFADLEVDVVIGTHPHVIQPIEYYTGINGNSLPVIYSLGNCVSGMIEFRNMVEGMITFDFVQDPNTKEITIENLLWTPLVDHYESNSVNFYEDRHNFRIYKLSDYSEELASKHALNLIGENVTLERLKQLTNQVIDERYRVN